MGGVPRGGRGLRCAVHTAKASVSVRNLLGLAERYELLMETGHQKSNAFKLSAVKPRWLGTDSSLYADASKQLVSHLKHSSHSLKLRTASVGCRVGTPEAPGGGHDLCLELGVRDVCKLPLRTASWAVMQQQEQYGL